MMKYFLQKSLLFISVTLFSLTSFAGQLEANDPMQNLFTPEQIQDMATEADRIKQDLKINNPAEYQKLLQLEQKLNSMSPEEQMQFIFMDPADQKNFIDDLSKDINPVASAPIEMPTMSEVKQEMSGAPTLPSITPEDKKEEIKRAVAEQSKQEKALEVIDGIVNGTSGSIIIKDSKTKTEYPGFLRQLNMLKGYVNEKRINKWAKQGKVRNWNSTYSWTDIKDKIDKLINILYKIKEPEKKSKDYKYLDELALDAGLINNLDRLKVVLFQQLPLIDSGAEEISEATKQSLAQIISAYIEALYEIKLIDALAKVIEKYDPTAKKLAEEEKAATQKALESSKYEPRYESAMYGGTPDSPSYQYYGGPMSLPSYDYGASSYGSYGSYAPAAPSAYDFGSPSSTSDRGGGGGYDPGSAGSPAASGYGSPTQPGENTFKDEEPREEGKRTASKDYAPQTEKPKKNKIVEKSVSKFEDNLADAMKLIKNNGFEKIKEHVLSRKSGPNIKMVEAIPHIVDKLNDAASDLSSLKGKITPEIEEQRTEIKNAFETNQKLLAKLVTDIQDIRSMESSISRSKQKAFLGKDTTTKKEEVKKAKEDKAGAEEELEEIAEVKPPLYQLQDAIEDLIKKYREI